MTFVALTTGRALVDKPPVAPGGRTGAGMSRCGYVPRYRFLTGAARMIHGSKRDRALG